MISISSSAASHLRTMLAERRSAEDAQGTVQGGAVPTPQGGGAQSPQGGGAQSPQGGGAQSPQGGGLEGKRGLRIVVEKGGCAGMQYEMRFDVSGPEDIVNESEGACVFVDPASARFLGGASLDYCDDLVGTGFRLHNPSAARSCGCGTSFEPLVESSVESSLESSVESLEDREEEVHSGLEQEREATATARL